MVQRKIDNMLSWFHPIHVFMCCCHMIIVGLNEYLGHSCWGLHLVSRVFQYEGLWASLSFAQWIVAKLLCSCLCLSDELTFEHIWTDRLSKNNKGCALVGGGGHQTQH